MKRYAPEMNELLAPLAECMTDEEKRILGITPDPAPERHLREGVERAMAEDNVAVSQQLVPLSGTRSTDRKDLFPWQGKESDGELMFNFESAMDAQDLYDFILESGLCTPGEIKLKMHDHQYSVHFAPNVLVQKPDVIQMAMIAYQDQLGEGCEEEWNLLAEGVDAVLEARALDEVVKISGAPARQPYGGNPFHDRDSGKFTGATSTIVRKDGGSWAIDKTKLKYTGSKKSKAGDLVVRFSATKRPCGREAREQGKNIRCWDGNKGVGYRLARALGKRRRGGIRAMEALTAADMRAIQECWRMYGIDWELAEDTARPFVPASGEGQLLAEDVIGELPTHVLEHFLTLDDDLLEGIVGELIAEVDTKKLSAWAAANRGEIERKTAELGAKIKEKERAEVEAKHKAAQKATASYKEVQAKKQAAASISTKGLEGAIHHKDKQSRKIIRKELAARAAGTSQEPKRPDKSGQMSKRVRVHPPQGKLKPGEKMVFGRVVKTGGASGASLQKQRMQQRKQAQGSGAKIAARKRAMAAKRFGA